MSVRKTPTYPVLIAGGGPVGLFLALCLVKSGIGCRVLEKRTAIDRHSKSLGIHPVSLELFDELGICAPFLDSGVKIRRGLAFTGIKRAGTVSFESCRPPHNYILALPQYRTEEILEQELKRADPGCLMRGAEVSGIIQNGESVQITCTRPGRSERLACSWLAGCDGKNSIVRRSAGIAFRGKRYPDTYVMGDFTDRTALGPDAAVYLHRDGLVESFPLPGGMRRWVAMTGSYVVNPRRETVERLVGERLQTDLSGCENSMVSSFGVQQLLCDTFFRNRIVLAGDSAHVVSPIGGQGMNLGWLTARDLAATLAGIHFGAGDPQTLLRAYSLRNRKIAAKVAMRASLNMWLGRKQKLPVIRNLLIRALVNTPLHHIMVRVFTMRGLEKRAGLLISRET